MVILLVVMVDLLQDLELETLGVMVTEQVDLMVAAVAAVVPVELVGWNCPYAGHGGTGIQAPTTFRPANTGQSVFGSPHGPSSGGAWFAGGGGGGALHQSQEPWRWTRIT